MGGSDSCRSTSLNGSVNCYLLSNIFSCSRRELADFKLQSSRKTSYWCCWSRRYPRNRVGVCSLFVCWSLLIYAVIEECSLQIIFLVEFFVWCCDTIEVIDSTVECFLTDVGNGVPV